MITRPFNFEAQLKRTSARMEAMPFVSVCAIAIFFSILSSRFVLAPGIGVKLPATEGAPPDYALTSPRVLSVKEVQGGEMLIFDGKILKLESFEKELARIKDEAPKEVLLVRADREVSTGLLVRVMDLATRAGFSSIQIATEPERATNTAAP